MKIEFRDLFHLGTSETLFQVGINFKTHFERLPLILNHTAILFSNAGFHQQSEQHKLDSVSASCVDPPFV